MINAVLALNELDTVVFDSPSFGAAPRIYDDFVTVPDAHLLFNGEFKRVGAGDLKIVGDDGQSFFIPDYFAAEKRAHLMSPEGATLSPRVVEALAGPLAPGQYAQAGAQPGTAQPVIGRVDTLTGSATVVRNGVSVTLNVGDTVRKGDVVQTAGGSSVAIVFADGSTFSLNANARMVLDDFIYNASGTGNSALINLVQGTFSFVAGQVAKTGEMRVETPVATMGIRGTAVLVEISANDGQTRFSVMVEPNGTTGSFNLYNKTTGTLIATVNNSQVGWLVSPAGPLQVLAQQVQKTPGELQQELGIVQQIFTIFNNNQQNPFVPPQQDNQERRGDKPNDTNPQTTQGTGGSGPNVTFDVPVTLPGNVTPTNVNVTITQILTEHGITLPSLPPTLPTLEIPTILLPTLNIINGLSGVINGTAGADQILGSNSDDTITAGAGNDFVYAEGGNDTVIAGEGEGNDFYDGGDGTEDVIKYESANGVVFNLNDGNWNLAWNLDAGVGMVKSSSAFSATTGLDVFIRFEKIVGSPGNDVFILHDAGHWQIDAGAGIDFVVFANGLDILGAEDGPDIRNFEVLDLVTDPTQNIVHFDFGDFDSIGNAIPLHILGGANDIINLTNESELNATWTLVEGGHHVHAHPQFPNPLPTDIFFDLYEVTVEGNSFFVYVQEGVQIALPGGNDAPVITTPPVVATVQEDATAPASGTMTFTDEDGGPVQRWSVVGGTTVGDADYTFLMDNLHIVKNGSTFFLDEFDDGVPPPGVPAGSTPPSYAANGFFVETGGRLVFDSLGSVPAVGVGTSDLIVGNFATLLTNIDPADLDKGLKSDDDFAVVGRFDLFNLPDSPRETFGIRLTDRLIGGAGMPPDQPGDDTIELVVRKGLGGTVIVQLREIDFANDTVTTLDTIALNAPEGADQIELRLTHDADNAGVIVASFDYLSDGEVVGTQTLTGIGHIFDNENWTRAQVVSYAPEVTDSYLAGTYGTLSINQAGQWNYFLANNQANVQELGAGDTVTDVFTVQISDGAGGFDTQTITVNVTGKNDGPAIVTADSDGSVGAGAPISTVGAGYLVAGHNLINGLGGTADFGENLLARNDDGSTGAIDITSVFGEQGLNFFGTNYTSFYINNNGNITFGGPLGTFTPSQIAGNNLKIIAPFWADVDTEGGDPVNGGTNLVYYDLDAENGVITITWDDVGYFNDRTDKLNAFQLQLIDRGDGNFDIVFRYEDVNWTTGDLSGGTNGLGGTPARAGFTAGDGNSAHYFELAGSGNQNSMLQLENTSGNTGIAGVHVFEVRSGDVGSPTSAGTIEFSDPDAGDTHAVSATFNATDSDEGPALGTLTTTLTRDTATGQNGVVTWNYVVTNSEAVDNLPPGTTRTEVYDVVVSDGHGGTVTQQVTITINGPEDGENHRPVLDEDASPTFAAVNEDAGAPVGAVGTLVSDLVDLDSTEGGLNNVSDTDAGAVTGIAIYGANQAHGTLFYSTNNGATWWAAGSVSDSTALLLAADANTRLYFQPDEDFSGTVSDVITFRAWDQTEGTNGGTLNIGAGGTNTDSVSSAPDTVGITVNSVNDAPQISVDDVTTAEGFGVTTLLGLEVLDPDAPAEEIFNITAVATHGTLSTADGGLNEFDQDDSPSGLEFHATLADINTALQAGIVYTDPAYEEGLTDAVVLTVTDAHGASDTINFIFSVFGDQGANLTGTAGKDVLFMTGNNDTLTGGDAADIFVFTPEGGIQQDTITDFTQGQDRIALYSIYGDFDDMVASGAFTNIGGNQIDLGDGHSITLQNFTAPLNTLTANDFMFNNLVIGG